MVTAHQYLDPLDPLEPRVPVLEPHHFVTEPMESERHLLAMMLFYELIRTALQPRKDVFVGADLVVYFSELQVKNKDFRAPDGFVVLGVEPDERPGWIVWKEAGKYPDLVVEHMSPSTRAIDLGIKRRIYGTIWKVREYFAFDLESGEIHAFVGTTEGLVPMQPNAEGRFVSEVLNAEVGVSDVPLNDRSGPWMRLYRDGVLVPTVHERADDAERRAQALTAEVATLRRQLAESAGSTS